MDPAAQNDNYESFLERDRMARSTSISSKVNFAGAGGGVDDNNSLGTTSIGRMGDLDELLELDMGFGNDGPLLDLFMNQATEIVQPASSSAAANRKKSEARKRKRADAPANPNESRSTGTGSRSSSRRKRQYKNTVDERHRRNVAEKSRIKKIKSTVDQIHQELVTYHFPSEKGSKKRMPKQRILVLALQKLQDLRKQNVALKRENSKLTAVVRKKDTEIEATALASLRNAAGGLV